MPNIFLAVSSHGYGHLSQIIAVANKILDFVPNTKFYIQGNLPSFVIAERLNTNNFTHDKVALDIGLIQPNPLEVNTNSTYLAYKDYHSNYANKVKDLADKFKKLEIDMVIANIPYIAIEASDCASIPSIAVASLTWDKIIENYLDRNSKEVKDWINQIRSSQAKATMALLPEPSMELDSFKKIEHIPPILLEGNKLPDLRRRLGIPDQDLRKIVLVSLGGIPAGNLPLKSLEKDKRFHWLIDNKFQATQENLHSLSSLENVHYRNLISSVDAVVGKPGYGTAVEVVKYQLPFLFTCRGNFADEPYIVNWLGKYARCKEISKETWLEGKFGDYLSDMINQPLKPLQKCDGAVKAAEMVKNYFL